MIRPGEVYMADFADSQPTAWPSAKTFCPSSCRTSTSHLDLAAGPLGIVDDVAFRDVIKAIGYVMDSECEPA